MRTLADHPLSSEFHPTKNHPKTPKDFLLQSNKKIWWQCSKGHDFESKIQNRTILGRGCKFCRNQAPHSGNNLSLMQYAKEWDYQLNFPEKPEDVLPSSNKRKHWICPKGHRYLSTPNNRKNGKGCPYCSGRLSSKENNLSLHPVAKEFHYERNAPLKPEDFTMNSGRKIWWQCPKHPEHEWEARVSDRKREDSKKTNCPYCINHGSSRHEQEILEYITSLNLNPLHRYKLDNQEADVFISEKNLAIEHNGLYWHSELHKDKNYHYTKYRHFADRGIQLIQIWEDEWRNKRKTVESLLRSKLGLNSDRVFARKCVIVKQKCPEFFELNHIQGSAGISKTYTLEYQGDIVAAMAFKIRSEGVWELVRYATSKSVVGGASKLLKAFEREYHKVRIVSFADLCVSNGDMYYKLGFKEDKILNPDYKYLVNSCREHKFNYRLKRFKNDPSLIFEEDKTESELAKINKLSKIYDAGKIRFVKN